MLSLKSVHLVLISISIVLTSGVGMWALLNNHHLMGAAFMVIAVLLVLYQAYFGSRAQQVHLD